MSELEAELEAVAAELNDLVVAELDGLDIKLDVHYIIPDHQDG